MRDCKLVSSNQTEARTNVRLIAGILMLVNFFDMFSARKTKIRIEAKKKSLFTWWFDENRPIIKEKLCPHDIPAHERNGERTVHHIAHHDNIV